MQKVLEALQNDTERLVIDLSCRRTGSKWMVAMGKWQILTDTEVNQGMEYCRTSSADTAAHVVGRDHSISGAVLFGVPYPCCR